MFDQFRDVLEHLARATTAAQRPARPASSPDRPHRESADASVPQLTFDEFKRSAASAAKHGYFEIPRAIEAIGISPSLSTLIERLVRETAKDGNERGRVLFVSPLGQRIFVDHVATGNSQSVEYSYSPVTWHEGQQFRAFGGMHTHPTEVQFRGLGTASPSEAQKRYAQAVRASEHLSITDLATLLSGNLASSTVLTEGNWLMVNKSASTPRFQTPSAQSKLLLQLERLFEDCASHGAVQQAADVARVFLKRACIEYDLDLFVSRRSERTCFRRVMLRPQL